MPRDLSTIGHALAAPVRARLLGILMDGSSRPASELALLTRVRPSTLSGHLGVLLDAGLIECVPRGRNRFFQLADPAVAETLELLGQLAPAESARTHAHRREARDLAEARLCYDHLAGRLGVSLASAMIASGWLDDELACTTSGLRELAARGIDVDPPRTGRRPLTRRCPDWTERRPHLAGVLGQRIAQRFLDADWVRRRSGSRGLVLTDSGRHALATEWNAPQDEEARAL